MLRRLSQAQGGGARLPLVISLALKSSLTSTLDQNTPTNRAKCPKKAAFYDVDGGHRRHLITVNALLKDPETHRDRGGVFVAELIRRPSAASQQDLEQLLRLMLFNAAIHNTDDHERNFSFRFDNDALRLAPAYDLVP